MVRYIPTGEIDIEMEGHRKLFKTEQLNLQKVKFSSREQNLPAIFIHGFNKYRLPFVLTTYL